VYRHFKGGPPPVARREYLTAELRRLVSKGVVARYAPGKYGLPAGVTVKDLLMAIDSDAYVTAAAALARHGLVTQVPQLVECFTRRRHNRSRERHSPLGTLVFTCVAPAVHAHPEGGLAGPGRAPYDLVFISRRHGLDPRSLCTFRHLGRVDLREHLLARYPRTLQDDVRRLVETARSIRQHFSGTKAVRP